MLEDVFRSHRVRRRIGVNPIGAVLERYAVHLVARGHNRTTVHQYTLAAEHFGLWLGRRAISRESADSFMSRHLASCRCKSPATRNIRCVRAALNRLLEMMGVPAGFAQPELDAGVARLLKQYADHLAQAQGLAPSTVRYRIRYANALLSGLRIGGPGQLCRLTVQRIVLFVTREGRRISPASGQVLSSCVRSFLRFLLLQKLIDKDLCTAVPGFANWRLASLPSTVCTSDLERLVGAVDATTRIGLRDRALLLCMVDLGLRASDVADMEWGGVDLARGLLHLRRRKQRQRVTIPMTRRLTTAIGAYIRFGRPQGHWKALFVQHRAPLGAPLADGIRGVVRRCALKAGLAERIRGTHVIRHSVARGMIDSGATLKQIADLLGHRSLDTTAIYAKVDLDMLRRVALPWPGSGEVAP